MSRDLSPAGQELVRVQEGVISRRQAISGGTPPGVIDSRIRSGRWLVLRPGIYSVFTGRPSRQATLWAAVLSAGPGAALSHQTAAELFRLTDQPSSSIHLTIPRDRRMRPAAGVVIHRSGRVAESVHPTLLPPRTRIEETVLDLVGAARTFEEAFGFVCSACQRRLTTAQCLCEAMSRRTKLRWRTELAVAIRDVSSGVHSVLEYRYVHRVERPHGLPAAARQVRVTSEQRNRYLDNLYRDYGLCVELDGRQAHPDDQRWPDQRRINSIIEQGLTVLRYGWADIDRWPCQVASQVGDVLVRLGWSGRVRPCGSGCAARTPADGAGRGNGARLVAADGIDRRSR
jgi:very-short-patch-repair endonuclease